MLICFDKAERHLPDRCLRQFGIRQPIPLDVQQWERKSRGVDGGVDLSGKMETELSEWSDRHLRVVDVDEDVEETEYLHWYLKITRKLVGRPIPISSEFQRMVYNLSIPNPVYLNYWLKEANFTPNFCSCDKLCVHP